MYNKNYYNKNIAFLFTIKNRTKFKVGLETLNLLGNCLDTLCNCLETFSLGNVDFYFADFQSDDCVLEEEIKKHIREPYNFKIFSLDGQFGRGPGFNFLLDNIEKKYDCICFLDADMIFLRDNLFTTAFSLTLNENKAYFPVCHRLSEDGVTKQPEFCGYGNCFIPGNILFTNGLKFVNKYTWGEEDLHFYNLVKNYCETIQEVIPGFYHQWHPR